MKTFLYWAITVILLAGGFAAGLLIHKAKEPTEGPAAAEAPKAEPGHVLLTEEQVKAAEIKAEGIKGGSLTPEVKLYGVLQEDPDEAFSVRAPVSGTLQKVAGKGWPMMGQVLADGTQIGALQPRSVPSDEIALAAQKAALQSQVAAAQADVSTATVALEAAQKEYERVKALNEQDKNVADKVVQEAQAKVKTEEAHVAGAKETLAVAKAALNGVEMKLPAMPLTVVRGGEVVEVACQPEESVEAGQEVLKVSRLDHLVAAVDVPLGQTIPGGVTEARVVTLNNDASPMKVTRMGVAPTANPKTRDNVYLFRMTLPEPSAGIRPGTPVTAYLALSGEPLKGYVVPRMAVVRYKGRAWVYVVGEAKEYAMGKEKVKMQDYERREVALEHATADGAGWFVMEGFKGDEKLVTTGAADLISVETNTFTGD
jgi:cobalt-zinc-cadmium efflux system membrane fusion protein